MSVIEKQKIEESETSEKQDAESLTTDETGDTKSPEEAEKEEEAKLRAKYPSIKGSGGSALLQKRLSKGTKYFDSGDYAMAKASTGLTKQTATAATTISAGQKLILPGSTGDAIPTPETVPHKKMTFNQSKLAGTSS